VAYGAFGCEWTFLCEAGRGSARLLGIGRSGCNMKGKALLFKTIGVQEETRRQMFEEAGWSVCGEASNGQEAIVKAQELRPNIMVLERV
jgi:hypothetical protein